MIRDVYKYLNYNLPVYKNKVFLDLIMFHNLGIGFFFLYIIFQEKV